MRITPGAGLSPIQNSEKTKELADPEVQRDAKKLANKFAEAEKAAEDFETMFVDIMLKAMRQTAKPEEESNAQDIYQGMLDGEYSKAMSSAPGGGLGIKQTVLDWMKNADPKLVGGAINTSELTNLKDAQRASKFAIDQYKIQGGTKF